MSKKDHDGGTWDKIMKQFKPSTEKQEAKRRAFPGCGCKVTGCLTLNLALFFLATFLPWLPAYPLLGYCRLYCGTYSFKKSKYLPAFPLPQFPQPAWFFCPAPERGRYAKFHP